MRCGTPIGATQNRGHVTYAHFSQNSNCVYGKVCMPITDMENIVPGQAHMFSVPSSHPIITGVGEAIGRALTSVLVQAFRTENN